MVIDVYCILMNLLSFSTYSLFFVWYVLICCAVTWQGVITEDVVQLRKSIGAPGMAVLQFGSNILLSFKWSFLGHTLNFTRCYVVHFLFFSCPGFGSGADNPHLPHNHEHNQVVYTGTHDNDTVKFLHGMDLFQYVAQFIYLIWGMMGKCNMIWYNTDLHLHNCWDLCSDSLILTWKFRQSVLIDVFLYYRSEAGGTFWSKKRSPMCVLTW